MRTTLRWLSMGVMVLFILAEMAVVAGKDEVRDWMKYHPREDHR